MSRFEPGNVAGSVAPTISVALMWCILVSSPILSLGRSFKISSAACLSSGTSCLFAESQRMRISMPLLPLPATMMAFPILESAHSMVMSSFASGWFLKPHLDTCYLPAICATLYGHVDRGGARIDGPGRRVHSLLMLPGVYASSDERCLFWARSRDLSFDRSRDLSLTRSRDLSVARGISLLTAPVASSRACLRSRLFSS